MRTHLQLQSSFGPAAQARIVEAVRILTVNDIPASKLSGRDMRRLSRQAPGTKPRLDVRHLGNVRTEVVVLGEVPAH